MANQIDGASTLPPPTSVRKKSFLIFRLLNLFFYFCPFLEFFPTSGNILSCCVVGINIQKGGMDVSHSYIVSTMEPLV
ncbi:unnamed protein product [Musa banksii]